MKIDMDENIINITLSEEEADEIKSLDSGAHEHFKDKHNELIVNKE